MKEYSIFFLNFETINQTRRPLLFSPYQFEDNLQTSLHSTGKKFNQFDHLPKFTLEHRTATLLFSI
jgi:hypothetical protein